MFGICNYRCSFSFRDFTSHRGIQALSPLGLVTQHSQFSLLHLAELIAVINHMRPSAQKTSRQNLSFGGRQSSVPPYRLYPKFTEKGINLQLGRKSTHKNYHFSFSMHGWLTKHTGIKYSLKFITEDRWVGFLNGHSHA